MVVPLTTTTVTWQQPIMGEPDEAPLTVRTIASGVRAHIGAPSGSDKLIGGEQEQIDSRLDCDPVDDVDQTCEVVDELTGLTYAVVWVTQRRGLGLDHTVAGMRRVRGRAS